MTQLNVLNSIVPSVDSQARHIAGSTFSCSPEYLLMNVHDLAPLDTWYLTPASLDYSYKMLLCNEDQIDDPDNFENQDVPDSA